MPKVTWLGDADPSVQVIDQSGYTFVKGVPTDVKDNDKALGKLRANAFFAIDKDADPVESDEPEPVDPDAGTELAAVRNELHERGIKFRHDAKIDALRKKLAESED